MIFRPDGHTGWYCILCYGAKQHLGDRRRWNDRECLLQRAAHTIFQGKAGKAVILLNK